MDGDVPKLLRQAWNSIITTSSDIDSEIRHQRNLEDVDYWRKRSGWFDDDASKVEYNSGVYDTYYNVDDDGSGHASGAGGSFLSSGNGNMSIFLKITAILLAVLFVVLIFRATQRRSGSSKDRSSSRHGSDSSRRSRSRSKSSSRRSRSRSRKRDGYDLMDDGESKKSGRSSRSRSRRRSRSRGASSSGRSRSKSKSSSARASGEALV
eukprot:CAMPEP_0194212702 /NCGR_PEP_ID=MMETSP0156-20130528/12743_1 /TAXON_ID=33649 /ORGANISM="Thalassionema nitzschioides, Strain L26-B" /LENGTH=207 /DNA_ID=CAMNT_0038940575 /DNA_START=51 /DNA_END=674 /DNA_ORIENTATION=-